MIETTKKQRYLDIGATILSGISVFVLGIIILLATPNDYYRFIYLTSAILIVLGFFHCLRAILKKGHRKDYFVHFLIETGSGIVILTFPNMPLNLMTLIFAIYLLITSMVYIINFLVLKKQKFDFKSLFLAFFCLLSGLFFLAAFYSKLTISNYLIAGYFIIWGISMIFNGLIDFFFKDINNPKIRVCLPAIIDCFIPNMWLNAVNKYYREEKKEPIVDKKTNQPHDIEVFIHASHNGFNIFGHVDVMFEGVLYSYGNYDGSSERFFTTIGDGVVFQTKDRDAYIRFCLKRCKKTLFVYGIRLNEKQKETIRATLKELNQRLVPWDPEFIHRPLDKNAPSINLHVHQIYNEAKGDLFKFSSGTFKTYYVLGSNCVRFVDNIIGKNIDIMKIVGFITPGTYLDYFEGEFKRASSNVVSKEIYSIHNYDVGEEDENDPYKDFD